MDSGHSSHLYQKKKWCGSNTYKPNGDWDDVAERLMLNFSESRHPLFRGTSALEEELCESKSVHFSGEVVFSHYHFRQSAQYLRSNSGHM